MRVDEDLEDEVDDLCLVLVSEGEVVKAQRLEDLTGPLVHEVHRGDFQDHPHVLPLLLEVPQLHEEVQKAEDRHVEFDKERRRRFLGRAEALDLCDLDCDVQKFHGEGEGVNFLVKSHLARVFDEELDCAEPNCDCKDQHPRNLDPHRQPVSKTDVVIYRFFV